MFVYLITNECSDSYYPEHPTRIAFFTRRDAAEFLKTIDDEESQYYSIKEIEVVTDDFAYANTYLHRQVGD
jgi:hypothetical protein